MILHLVVFASFIAYISAYPYPYPFPFPYPEPTTRCCIPAMEPGCLNPCPPPPPMMMMMPPPPPPPQPMMFPQQCCMPSPTCYNPCPGFPQQPMSTAYQKTPKAPVVYAPLPGEIVFKLLQNWDPEFVDSTSASYQILEGNIRSAVQAVLGPNTQVTNIYFREGYVPGNPSTRPKTVAHMMVNGGSDAASLLEHAVTPDGSLGDGLKVYRDSFNAY